MFAFLGIGVATLALGPLSRSYFADAATSIAPTGLPSIAGCRSLQGWVSEWSPKFVAPDYVVAESYQCAGYRLHVSVAQYVDQHQGKEAVGEFNSVIPRSWWNYTTRTRREAGEALEVDEYRVELPPTRLTIWNWYAVGVRPTSAGLEVKMLEALNAMRLHATATTNLTVAVEADQGFDPAPALREDATAIWAWFTAAMTGAGG